MDLKMRSFWKKAVKIAAASGAPPPNLRCPGVVTPAKLLQHFVECVSSAKRVLLRSEKYKCSISRSFTFTFASIFHFRRLCSFVNGGCKNIFCLRVQGTLATPLHPRSQFNHSWCIRNSLLYSYLFWAHKLKTFTPCYSFKYRICWFFYQFLSDKNLYTKLVGINCVVV